MKSMSIQSLAEVDLDQFIMELTKVRIFSSCHFFPFSICCLLRKSSGKLFQFFSQNLFQKVVAVALLLHCATGFVSDQNSNFIDDPESSGIDFSTGTPGPDGTVCVQRQKFFDKTEKDQLKECFVQNVTTCYYTYITAYSDQEQEKCDEFFWKSCKIVFKTRPFNATSRICQRPLIKQCDQKVNTDPYSATAKPINFHGRFSFTAQISQPVSLLMDPCFRLLLRPSPTWSATRSLRLIATPRIWCQTLETSHWPWLSVKRCPEKSALPRLAGTYDVISIRKNHYQKVLQ